MSSSHRGRFQAAGTYLIVLVLSFITLFAAPADASAKSSAKSTAVPKPRAAAKPSAVLQVRRLGFSVQGRAIYAYRLGEPTSKTKVILLGQMHGDEHAGVTVAQAAIEGRPVAGIDLWVILSMNPDGDHANTRLNARGVDLNRNWPDYWSLDTGNFPPGPAPLSEPETRAMYAFVNLIKPTYLVSIHQPLDGVDTTDGGARDPGFSARLAHNLGLALKPFRCFSFCHGSMTGWITDHQRGVAVTVEFPAGAGITQLRDRAPAEILSAIPGFRYARPQDRNPVVSAIGARVLTTNPKNPAGAGHTGSIVELTGSAWDPDLRSGALIVTAREGARLISSRPTTVVSPSENSRYALVGAHRYLFRFAATPGSHRYCISAANRGAGSMPAVTACTVVKINSKPYGRLDSVTANPDHTVTFSGWAVDPQQSSAAVTVVITIDPASLTPTSMSVPTSAARPDVNRAYAIAGNHGFIGATPVIPAGAHQICAQAQPTAFGAVATALGCVTVELPAV